MKAIGKKIVVKLIPEDDKKSEGGIIMPETANRGPARGTVLSAGHEVERIVEGDIVLFPRHTGVAIGRDIVVLHKDEVLYVE